MSLATAYSRALSGMHAPQVVVEAHVGNGLPAFKKDEPYLHRIKHSVKQPEGD
jgi:magnesium chelatase family protein